MQRFGFFAILALGLAACAPPALEVEPRITASAIDSARLMHDIGVLAHDSMEGRLVGTPGNARARTFLERSFSEIGLRPLGTEYSHAFTFERQQRQITGFNVLGYVPGTSYPDRYIVVTAHYDHLGVRDGEIFNGADDNASGTAGMLALARHFMAAPTRHTLIFAALDAEEGGLHGARAFVANPPVDRAGIVLNVNLDMVGRNDAGELYVAGTHHYPHLLPIVQRAIDQAEVTLIPGHDTPNPENPTDDWTMASDHAAFHLVGIPFLYFGVEDHPDYHRPTDTLEGIQPGFFTRAVRTVLTSLRLLDESL
jgi:Zn-dependent M28 family amino/carboxypeptidase